MTAEITSGTVKLPDEVLEEADVTEGDEFDVYVDDVGRIVLERTRVHCSGQAFLDSIRARMSE